jgi:VIT1/CCC1 family predicted Fe2+/Mn2+ transporter
MKNNQTHNKEIDSHENRVHDSELLAGRASQVQAGAARAAVLGVNDGLVSVLCIVLGVAGAHAKPTTVLLAGFAGLIAGAISMAAGEWISVTSQVELFEGILSDVRHLVKHDRELLIDELKKDYENDGLSTSTAALAVSEVSRSDERLYSEYTEHVIGINSAELGSPWKATISSFVLFTAGAITALIPWFFGGGLRSIVLSITFTAIGGLIVGAYIAKSSGNTMYKGALRQLFIIILASAVTYGVGHLFGAAVH